MKWLDMCFNSKNQELYVRLGKRYKLQCMDINNIDGMHLNV